MDNRKMCNPLGFESFTHLSLYLYAIYKFIPLIDTYHDVLDEYYAYYDIRVPVVMLQKNTLLVSPYRAVILRVLD